MKRILIVTLALILFEGLFLIQDAPVQAATRITPGTIIPAELSKSVDAKKAKAGDKIEAKTVVDLLSNGQVLIPKGSKILGHVTDSKARSKDSKDSMVGIVFDSLSLKDGSELTIQAVVQAIGRPVDQTSSSASTSGGPIGSSGKSMPSSVSGRPPDSSGNSLDSNSQGIVGLKGLSLDSSGEASVISSSSENVHLDGGSQLTLRIK